MAPEPDRLSACPCGDTDCTGSYLHGWSPEHRDYVQTARRALRISEAVIVLVVITLALALLLGTLIGCSVGEPPCVSGVVSAAAGPGYGWADALDRACPSTRATVAWSEYDRTNGEVNALCVCHGEDL